MQKPIRVTINLSPEGHAKIKADAEKRNLPISAHMAKKCGVKPLPMGRRPNVAPSFEEVEGKKS